MRTIKGPGLFLAQFARDAPPHNSLGRIARWAGAYGYKAIQIPTWDARFFDLDKAYASETYCDEIKGALADIGIAISELSTHFQGQMVSVHPAYDAMFDGQCPEAVRGNPEKRRHWAAEQVRKAAKVSRRLGLTEHVSFTGSLAWPASPRRRCRCFPKTPKNFVHSRGSFPRSTAKQSNRASGTTRQRFVHWRISSSSSPRAGSPMWRPSRC